MRNRVMMSMSAFLIAWAPLFGQTPAFYNPAMPSNMEVKLVSAIEQDPSGMIWMGTSHGVYSYDAYSMYRRGEDDSRGRVYCLKYLEGDALYVGDVNGLWAYDYSRDCFRERLDGTPSEVRALLWDKDRFWVGSSTGLYSYSPLDKKFSKINGCPAGSEVIYSIVRASDGNIYLGTYNGFLCYDPYMDHFKTVSLPCSQSEGNLFVNALQEDCDGKFIWVGTDGHLYRYELKGGRIAKIPQLEGNVVKSFEYGRDGTLYIGTDNGLFLYNSSGVIRHVRHNARLAGTSLVNDIVWDIFTDHDGNVWFGTDEGVSMLNCENSIRFIPVSDITSQSLGNHIMQILRDRDGTMWLGGTNGLIRTSATFDSTKWYSIDNPSGRIWHNHIRRIYEDRDGDLWICTDGGVHYLEDGIWRHVNLYDSSSGCNANWAYDIYEDRSGRMWVAGNMGGLIVAAKDKILMSGGNCCSDAFVSLPDGRGLSPFRIVEDGAGFLRVLYYNDGLHRINPLTLEVSEDVGLADRIGGENPGCILLDSSQKLWLGLDGRLLYKDGNMTGEVKLHHGAGYVNWLLEVDDAIWAGAGTGIWIIRNGAASRHYELKYFVDDAYYDKKAKTVYLGTNDGVYLVSNHPDIGRRDKRDLFLTGVSVNGLPVGLGGNDFAFDSDQRHIEFYVSDFSYGTAENVRYSYRMRNSDTAWFDLPKGGRVITLSNIGFGKFILDVRRQDSADDYAMLSIPFSIRYPFYLRWWAFVLYFFVLSSSIAFIIRSIRVKNRLFYERREKDHIMEQIELKKEFLHNLSRELERPLGNILSPVSVMISENSEDNITVQMERIRQEADNLSAAIRQIADFETPKAEVLDYSEKTLSETDRRFISKLESVIEENYSDSDFNIQSLCKEMGFGDKYVYRKVKELTDKSPVDYLRTCRLKKAASMLEKKKLTVTEVMYMSGFKNASYFSKCFQREFGCTPREYLER